MRILIEIASQSILKIPKIYLDVDLKIIDKMYKYSHKESKNARNIMWKLKRDKTITRIYSFTIHFSEFAHDFASCIRNYCVYNYKP